VSGIKWVLTFGVGFMSVRYGIKTFDKSVADDKEKKTTEKHKAARDAVEAFKSSEVFAFIRSLVNTKTVRDDRKIEIPPSLRGRPVSSLPPNTNGALNAEVYSFLGREWGNETTSEQQKEIDEEIKRWRAIAEKQTSGDGLPTETEHVVENYTATFVRALTIDDQAGRWSGEPRITAEAEVYRKAVEAFVAEVNKLAEAADQELVIAELRNDRAVMDTLSVLCKPIRFTLPTGKNIAEGIGVDELQEWHKTRNRERTKNPAVRMEHYEYYMFFGWEEYLRWNDVVHNTHVVNFLHRLHFCKKGASVFDTPPKKNDEKWLRRLVDKQVAGRVFKIDREKEYMVMRYGDPAERKKKNKIDGIPHPYNKHFEFWWGTNWDARGRAESYNKCKPGGRGAVWNNGTGTFDTAEAAVVL